MERFQDVPGGRVVAVSVDGAHRFSKTKVESIDLVAGFGAAGDAHAGVTVQHRYLADKDAAAPNLRQVHLLHEEFLDEVRDAGFDVPAGGLGENILTAGVDLLGLPTDTVLRLGPDAVVRVTGLRNPCNQIDSYRPGLQALCYGVDADGQRTRRAGVMGVVEQGGVVRAGDAVDVVVPAGTPRPLDVV